MDMICGNGNMKRISAAFECIYSRIGMKYTKCMCNIDQVIRKLPAAAKNATPLESETRFLLNFTSIFGIVESPMAILVSISSNI